MNRLVGRIITSIEGAYKDSEEIIFRTADGDTFRMYHWQSCCESVSVEDVCGDIAGLIGKPIVRASEDTNDGNTTYGTFTWTFYNIATADTHVTIRWYGSSNGYYSESVSFEKIN